MKKGIQVGAIILVIVVALSAGLAVILLGNRSTHMHYVCLEVNPRVEFLTDNKHKVKSFKPLNQEAKELLINEEIVGLNIDDACNKFLTLCAQAGYLKVDGENAVKLSVLSGLNQGLELNLHRLINKFFVDNNILGVVVESSDDLAQFKAAKKLGVSSEKYDLMLAVQENDNSKTLEELKHFSNKKLLEMIDESQNNYTFEYLPSELANKVALIDFNRSIYDSHMASITAEGTREFKKNLDEFKKVATKKYKLGFDNTYEEWLIG